MDTNALLTIAAARFNEVQRHTTDPALVKLAEGLKNQALAEIELAKRQEFIEWQVTKLGKRLS